MKNKFLFFTNFTPHESKVEEEENEKEKGR